MNKQTRFLLALLISLPGFAAFGQGQHIVLNQPITGGQHTYTATESIRMVPGFSYKPLVAGDYFVGRIGDYVSQEVTPPEAGTIGGPNEDDEGYVGVLEAGYSVNDNGSFTYSVSIDVPPGRAGMIPEVNLTYNSGVSDGLLGLGWSLDAVSMISHTARTYHHDGSLGFYGGDFSAGVFMLDGTRLISVGTNEYRKEIDDFSRIRKVFPGSGYYFEVKTKSGLVYEYGRSTSVHRCKTSGPPSYLQNFAYYISSVRDNYGNRIEYNYTTNQNTGEIYLINIEYLNNVIEFQYESIDDISKAYYSYMVGVKGALTIQNTKVLNKVVCKQDGHMLWEYCLDYEKRGILSDVSNPIRLLKSIQKKMANGEQLNKTRFSWDGPVTYGQTTAKKYNINSNYSGSKQLYYGNFFGNASKDLIMFHKSYNFQYLRVYENRYGQFVPKGSDYSTNIENGNIIVGDYNGDGFDDFVHYEYRDNTLHFHVYINNRYGFFESHPITTPTGNQMLLDIIPGDFNGDGISDIMFRTAPAGELFFLLGDPNNTNGHLTTGMYSPRKFISEKLGITPGHFTGSNRTELFGRGYIEANNWVQNIYTFGKNGTSYPLLTIDIDSEINLKGQHLSLVDLNGDGKSDIIKLKTTAEGNEKFIDVDCYHTYGSDFLDVGTYRLKILDEVNPEYFDHYIVEELYGDFNGDGRSDILALVAFEYHEYYYDPLFEEWFVFKYYDHYKVYLYSNKSGTGFSGVVSNGTPHDFSKYASLDLSGNGAHDIVVTSFNGNNPGDYFEHQSDRYKINRIVDGIGKWIEIDYTFTADQSCYLGITSVYGYSYPHSALTTNFPIVSAISVDDGFEGSINTTYKYQGGLLNLQGIGFYGFRRRIAMSQELDLIIENIAELNSDYNVFVPVSTSKRVFTTGKNISTKVFSYKIFPTVNPNTLFVTQQSVRELQYDPFGDSTPVKYSKQHIDSFDNYGNPLVIVNESGRDGILLVPENITTITNYYNNIVDDNNWILGRLYYAKTVYEYDNEKPITSSSAFTYYESGKDFGMLKDEIFEPGGKLSYVKTYTYDEFGNIFSSELKAGTNFESRIEQSEYDPEAKYKGVFLTKHTNSAGHTNQYLYDYKNGNLIESYCINNYLTMYQYDPLGRLFRTISPEGNQQVAVLRWIKKDDRYAPKYAVFYEWEKSSITSPVIIYRNRLGMEIRRIVVGFNGEIILTDFEYNKRGQLIGQSAPYKEGEPVYYQTFEYDKIGRLTKTTTPQSGGDAITDYFYEGLTTKIINPLGQESVFEYNAAGWLVLSTDPTGKNVLNEYYSDGKKKMTFVENFVNSSRYFEYDNMGNLVTYKDSSQGEINYEYNAFGDLMLLSTPIGTTTYPEYDKLGRLRKRIAPEGTTTWEYDRHGENGLLYEEKLELNSSIIHQIMYNFDHDNVLRLESVQESIDGEHFNKSFDYDVFGRPVKLTFPSGYTLNYTYNLQGYQNKVIESGSGNVLWEAKGMNERNQYTEIGLGGNIIQNLVYDPISGRILNILAGNLQHNTYTWDKIGNLKSRKSHHHITEDFDYDALNRLTYVKHNSILKFTHEYDDLGNITYKSDVGVYAYNDHSNPYKLSSIDNRPVTINADNQHIDYNSYNKVTQITEKDPGNGNILRQLDILYGVGNQRSMQQMQIGQNLTTKFYVGGDYEVEDKDGEITRVHYIYAPSGLAAIVRRDAQNNDAINFVLSDHLGSVQVLANAAGQLLEEFSYDPWGLRRDPVTLDVYAWAEMPVTGMDYGFTGHEHLDIFMLVNMNGRMYDPVVGRFLTPDPVLQFPNYTQGLNPYTYALNNPLRFVDPDGYSIGDDRFFAFMQGIGSAGASMVMFAAVINPLTLPAALIGAFFIVGINTTMISMAKGAPVKDAIMQGITAGSMTVLTAVGSSQIGSLMTHFSKSKAFWRTIIRAGAHGTFNGGISVMQGGKFQHGFMAGFASSAGGCIIQGKAAANWKGGVKIAAAAVIGGTAEKLGGGKFANGAVTGAYVMMFNHLASKPQKGRNVPTKEWMEAKAKELIEWEKARVTKTRNGESTYSDRFDLHFEGYANQKGHRDRHGDIISVQIEGQNIDIYFEFHPAVNSIHNQVTSIRESGIASFYGMKPGLKGMHHIQIWSVTSSRNQMHIGSLYLNETNYRKVWNYIYSD